jgi:cytochrome c oxidase assembly protein subunit 15
LVAGVIGQIVLGGVTVLTDLHPAAVQAHFVLSIVILTDALVLHQRASEEPGPYRPAPDRSLRRAVLAASALVGLAIVTGTVVTGTGPHGGDEDVRRFGFAITDVARIHSVTALVAAAALVWLAWRARRGPAWAVIGEPLGAVLAALVVQGTIGYTQYFNGIPVPLVALHVIGSVVVWWLVCRLTFATRIPVPQPSPSPDLLSTSEGQVSAVNR